MNLKLSPSTNFLEREGPLPRSELLSQQADHFYSFKLDAYIHITSGGDPVRHFVFHGFIGAPVEVGVLGEHVLEALILDETVADDMAAVVAGASSRAAHLPLRLDFRIETLAVSIELP